MLRCAGLDERDVRRVRIEQEVLEPLDLDDWSGIVVGGGPWNVSDPEDEKDARPGPRRGTAARARAPGRRGGLPVPRRLLRHRHARHPGRRRRRPDLQRADRARWRSRSPTRAGGTSCSVGCPTRSPRCSATRRRCPGCPTAPCCLASSATCPVQAFRIGTQRLRHPVPPRAGPRGDHHARSRSTGTTATSSRTRPTQIVDGSRDAHVTEPPRILERFVELFARD